ncbi:hypothetical protein C8R46DRAFT_1062127 [Mycena filopes]|nr:hypothetical protein C8R46DRAFT_1062127 [Mycena filopes]
MSDSDKTTPILSKETLYSEWKSDAKAHLRRKEVFGCCLTASSDAVANEKCAGILWGMLSKDVKPLVKQYEDNPKAMWENLELLFAPRKAGARFNAYRTLTSIHLREDETLLSLTGRVSSAMRLLKDSKPAAFTLDNADEELQSVVLLMALLMKASCLSSEHRLSSPPRTSRSKTLRRPLPITRHFALRIRRVTVAKLALSPALPWPQPPLPLFHPHHLLLLLRPLRRPVRVAASQTTRSSNATSS